LPFEVNVDVGSAMQKKKAGIIIFIAINEGLGKQETVNDFLQTPPENNKMFTNARLFRLGVCAEGCARDRHPNTALSEQVNWLLPLMWNFFLK